MRSSASESRRGFVPIRSPCTTGENGSTAYIVVQKFLQLGEHADARGGQTEVVIVRGKLYEGHLLAGALQRIAFDFALFNGHGHIVCSVPQQDRNLDIGCVLRWRYGR